MLCAFVPRWLAAPCLAAAALASCAEYDSSLLIYSDAGDGGPDVSVSPDASEDPSVEPEAEPEAAPEAAPDAESDADSDVFDPHGCDPCQDPSLARAPCKPPAPNPAGGEQYVFAVDTVRMGLDANKPDDWRQLGLDRDCLKTPKTGEPMPCIRAQGAPVETTEDGLEGRDNSFGRNMGGLVVQLESFKFISNVEEDQNQNLLEGRSGILAVIENWSGERDDPTVTFSLYLSRGVYESTGTTEILAKWDGNDLWSRDKSSVGINDKPKFVDDAAWVTDGVLVAHLPAGLPLEFSGATSSLVMSLNESVITFRVADDKTSIQEGVLAGVWNADAALASMKSFAEQSGVCPNDPMFFPVEQAVVRSPDIRLNLEYRPDLECNAMSLAMAFTGKPAKLGPIVTPPPPQPSPCDAGADAP
jgi:hypothetical protein